jgi:hypothetical protein
MMVRLSFGDDHRGPSHEGRVHEAQPINSSTIRVPRAAGSRENGSWLALIGSETGKSCSARSQPFGIGQGFAGADDDYRW